ncbi:MAG: PDDEXK nuclease domain-containing protein [Methanoregula sp.]|jgi:predicted nuclease of restriction endonuclease-like (RecB) superfamily|uniref:PDDEXK nuclease domain-containing protein n=1 Tax=Methanoregula sp. TaxID=2052170 RepID=UPI0025E658D7|nr:PDDEXK nuclease domain-containing protein [Methanoregula sp.]MCK9631032.1 PDDEXK nuclease domain-containing protein [Methanoregula sp.]
MNRRITITPDNQKLPPDYPEFIASLKNRIRSAQVNAVVSVNRELIILYWQIGRDLVEKQDVAGWGTKIIDTLARDLQGEFPGAGGFSRTNLYRMRAFFQAYPPVPIVPQAVGQTSCPLPEAILHIPWGHNVILIEKVKDPVRRIWYARMAVGHSWSRAILQHQIDSDLYSRQGKALTNFPDTLPAPQSDLALQTFKDPYIFSFLTLGASARERDLEQGLMDHIQKFLLELGVGFSFVGRQFLLEVEGSEYYIDLLFYHLKLRCFVVIDLKMEEFSPEHAGKMNFYLSVVDDRMRQPGDHPSIGLVLCKTKKHLTVEYALRDMGKPIGVSEWRTRSAASLPEELRGSLPTIEELEQEIVKKYPGQA